VHDGIALFDVLCRPLPAVSQVKQLLLALLCAACGSVQTDELLYKLQQFVSGGQRICNNLAESATI
jgi:hypothetical protein